MLARKFARDAEELSRAAVLLGEISTLVKPARRVKALPDDPDKRVLAVRARRLCQGRRPRQYPGRREVCAKAITTTSVPRSLTMTA